MTDNEKYDLVYKAYSAVQQFIEKNPQGVVHIRGATATGKTGLSLALAELPHPNPPLKGEGASWLEIISADSRQVYRKMDIGTDKITLEQQQAVPHRAIDVVDPDEEFTAGQWKALAQQKIAEIQSRNKIPFVVGGTGLYHDMLYRNFSMPEIAPQRERRTQMEAKESASPGLLFAELQKVDPEEAMKHHPNSLRYILRALEIAVFSGRTKTAWSGEGAVAQPMLLLGLRREKEETNRLINKRIKEQFARGLIDEVQGLLDAGYSPGLQSMNGIGYKEIVGYLQGLYDLEKAEELLKHNTHQLAKKQRTWFRRYIMDAKMQPKEGVRYEVLYLE